MKEIQKRTLEKIDNALKQLYSNRLEQFKRVNKKYCDLRKTNHLGFEALISAELYIALQQEIDIHSVFLEYPGLSLDRIDLAIDGIIDDLIYRGFIEMKMFYGRDPNCYSNDFDKLKEMIIGDKESVGVQIHFELYQNKNRPNHKLIDGYASSLKATKYWSDVKLIGDDEFHFYRLAFGQK